MTRDLGGMRVAILATDGVERVELEQPRGALYGAGAETVDEEVVVDGQFTTSRSPADLPAFCPAIVAQFAGSRVQG